MLLAKVATTHPAPRASATCIHGLIGENYCGFWMLLEGLWHGAPRASLAKHCSLLFASRQCSNEGSMVFAGRPGRCSWPNRMTPNSSSRFGHPNYFLNPYSCSTLQIPLLVQLTCQTSSMSTTGAGSSSPGSADTSFLEWDGGGASMAFVLAGMYTTAH